MKWIAFTGPPKDGAPPLADSAQKLRNAPIMTAPIPDMKPIRWLAFLPLSILPLLAAGATQGPRLERALEARIGEALEEAGQGWARHRVTGRDVLITGTAPDKTAAERARSAAAANFGVRTVRMRAVTAGP